MNLNMFWRKWKILWFFVDFSLCDCCSTCSSADFDLFHRLLASTILAQAAFFVGWLAWRSHVAAAPLLAELQRCVQETRGSSVFARSWQKLWKDVCYPAFSLRWSYESVLRGCGISEFEDLCSCCNAGILYVVVLV